MIPKLIIIIITIIVVVQGVSLETPPLNYLFMHSMEKGAYCIGVFDNGAAGTLLGGITFRNILVQVMSVLFSVFFGCLELWGRCLGGSHSETSSCR